MSLEEGKKFFKNLSIIGGIIWIFFTGLANSVYSETRWPTVSGIQAIRDFLFYSYSNPYALICGVLFYLFFNRLADKLEDIRIGKNDYTYIIISLCLVIWTYIICSGILVY